MEIHRMVRKAKNKTNQRKPLNREGVLRKAISIADQKGLDGLSMRKLARASGVEAMSLYNHVANKEDLLDGMVDHVVAQIDLPEIGGEWKLEMSRRSISAHKILLSHPWAIKMLMSQSEPGPAIIQYVDATVGCLIKAGFSYELADRAWNLIDSHVYGFTLQAINFPFEPSVYKNIAKEFLPQLSENQFPYLRCLAEQVIDGSYDGVHDFCFGLDLILDALEKKLINNK